MYHSETFVIDDPFFKNKFFHWADQYSHACILDSHHYTEKKQAFAENNYDLLAGIGCVNVLQSKENALENLKMFYDRFCQKEKNWLFGFFTYDLKNDIEKLTSTNFDGIQFPGINFFTPEIVFELKENNLSIHIAEKSKIKPTEVLKEILSQQVSKTRNKTFSRIKLSERVSKKEYFDAIKKILQHIQRGDVYELNYCQEFFAEKAHIDPIEVFKKLCMISPTPFSCYYKLKDHYLMCASPERFLRKQGAKIISQPIKGTIHRGKNKAEDLQLKWKLQTDEKERSENVMIVDLVRNDLSRIAERGSVKVDELFGIYSFSHVHQMISTVSCTVKENVHPVDIMKAAFPMGSMTGAPKIRAMELIEHFESTKRGLFSGSAGYFSPGGNFDFNVVIRSILYNAMNHYLSVMVGGAITAKSDSEAEYNECLLKAEAMMKALKSVHKAE